eukprot:scaffold26022_cov27-Prasinocladus_malaysianus.AAC.4
MQDHQRVELPLTESCCDLQGRNSAAVSAFTKASNIEPRNETYKAQLQNAQAQMRAPEAESSDRHSYPRPSGPGLSQRATQFMLRQFTSAMNWWHDLTPDQRKLLAAGIVVGILFVLYYVYDSMFGYDSLPSSVADTQT